MSCQRINTPEWQHYDQDDNMKRMMCECVNVWMSKCVQQFCHFVLQLALCLLFVFLGSSTPIRHISLRSLIPNTDAYMTYEGSTTHPGCWESTVWIILNKPIYITKQEVILELAKLICCSVFLFLTNFTSSSESHWYVCLFFFSFFLTF